MYDQRRTFELHPREPPKLTRIDLARYDSEPIPEREWGVRDRFPRRSVCLLSGEGGVGKSIVLLQLAAAHGLGKDWLGAMPEEGDVVAVNCEDEGGEIVRRFDPIRRYYDASFSDLHRGLHIFPLAEEENPLLAVLDKNRGRIVPTPLYHALFEQVREVQPVCVIIDNVADVFGGSEIDRSQVRQFVGLMRQIARAGNSYVIMSAHPSLTGISSKSGLSGSTQWHNSVRARAFLHCREAETDIRALEFRKNNYGPLCESIELQWHNGLFLPVPVPTAPEQAARNAKADAMFLQMLDKAAARGDNVSAKQNANNYAPAMFAKATEAKQAGFKRDDFVKALDRLLEGTRITLEPYGPPSRGFSKIVRTTPAKSVKAKAEEEDEIEKGAGTFLLIGWEPIHPCRQCGKKDDQVLLIKDPNQPGKPAEPLHDACAAAFFGRPGTARTRSRSDGTEYEPEEEWGE